MVSHSENGSDSPIGLDRDRGRERLSQKPQTATNTTCKDRYFPVLYSLDFITQKLFKRSSKIMKLSSLVLYISNEIFENFQFIIVYLRPSTT